MSHLAAIIDHTLLRADATAAQIETLCAEARAHRFWSVCVNPARVPLAKRLLEGSPCHVCTVIGFPLGATLPQAKADEARRALDAGADELDMVMDIGAALDGRWDDLARDIRTVALAKSGHILKVILETAFLNEDAIRRAASLCAQSGADFAKTSTGFAPTGATLDAVRAIRDAVGPGFGVKASGGIRDRAAALAMVDAGATRLGTSASVAIISGTPSPSPTY